MSASSDTASSSSSTKPDNVNENENENDEKYLDEYEQYNIEQDKYESHGHSGKGRTKKEAQQHHHEDQSGHTRKDVTKLMNNHHKQCEKRKEHK